MSHSTFDSPIPQDTNPLEHQWINVYTGDSWCEVKAIVIGSLAVHPIIDEDWPDVYTITHVDSGLRFLDFSDLFVALKFANEISNLCDFGAVAQRFLDKTLTEEDNRIREYVWWRRLHVSYIPTFDDIKKIRNKAPWFLDTRRDDRFIVSSNPGTIPVAPIVGRANGGQS